MGTFKVLNYKLKNLPHRLRGWKAELCEYFKIGARTALSIRVINPDGTVLDLGIVSRRLITNNGAAYIVDAFQNLVELENMNYHASGTGTTAEAATDSALVSEVATRVAGTQSEPAANQYRTVATIPYTGTLAITEHGIFSASSVGVLLDRSVFSAINVVNGSSIEFTYTATVSAGG